MLRYVVVVWIRCAGQDLYSVTFDHQICKLRDKREERERELGGVG